VTLKTGIFVMVLSRCWQHWDKSNTENSHPPTNQQTVHESFCV